LIHRFFVIPRSVVEQLYTMKDAIESQEMAFRAMGLGKSKVLPVLHSDVDRYSGHLEIKPGVATDPAVYGLKLISLYPKNPKSRIPAMQAIIIINDARTGVPIAITDGVHITNLRTAAAGALGAKYLARRDSRNVGVIGTGTQGRLQVIALREVFKVQTVKAWSPSASRRSKYAVEMEDELGMPVRAVDSVREATRDADILVTATPATAPIVKRDWIDSGMHISSIGADRRGKQELEGEIYNHAKIFTDCREVAIQKGLFGSARIFAELGEVVAGIRKGRESDEEITIFDSSGVGVQDVFAAEMVYRRARAKKLGYSTTLS
jgi:alanine dehydrogenase